MRKFIIFASAFLLLVVVAITVAGCGGSSVMPTPQLAHAPMGAFIEATNSQRDIYTATNDGSGLTKIDAQPHTFNSVYVLPDGSKGVFAAQDSTGYSQIYYLASVDSTTKPVQLTSTPSHKIGPMLSADGSKIVFEHMIPQLGAEGDVWIMNIDGSNLHVIPIPAKSYPHHPFLSPDGSKVVVELSAGKGIFIMNVDGSNLRQITQEASASWDHHPAFSPDGKQVTFDRGNDVATTIMLVNADGTGETSLNASGSDPLFVADRIMLVKTSAIYSIKADGSDLRQVTGVTNNTDAAFWMAFIY